MHTILVTGGLGFIGSETVIALIAAGYEPIIVDDLYNAKKAVLDRIETITHVRPKFYEVDVTKRKETEVIFKITEEELRFLTENERVESENGVFEVFIGSDSTTENKAEFVLKK